jgi:hypothetical protein
MFYPADFLTGTADMSAIEVGGYIRLLCYQWLKGELPDDNEKLIFMAGVKEENIPHILSKFIKGKNGKYYNKKLEIIREEYKNYCRKQKNNAIKRWHSNNLQNVPSHCGGIPTAMPADMPDGMPKPCSSSSLSSSIVLNPPLPPKGDMCGVNKKISKMSQAEKKRVRVAENNPVMIRIGKWFNRSPETLWSIYESQALEQLGAISEEEMIIMEKYYNMKIMGKDYRRRDIATLLNNWHGELDRARNYKPELEDGLSVGQKHFEEGELNWKPQ